MGRKQRKRENREERKLDLGSVDEDGEENWFKWGGCCDKEGRALLFVALGRGGDVVPVKWGTEMYCEKEENE